MRLFKRDVFELIIAFAIGFFVAWAYGQATSALVAYEEGFQAGKIEVWNLIGQMENDSASD